MALLVAGSVAAQNNPASDPRDATDAAALLDRGLGRADDDLSTLTIRRVMRRYQLPGAKSPTRTDLEPPDEGKSSPAGSSPQQTLVFPLSSHAYPDKGTRSPHVPVRKPPHYTIHHAVQPREGKKVMLDWRNRNSQWVVADLSDEFDRSDSSPCNNAVAKWVPYVSQINGRLGRVGGDIRLLSGQFTRQQREKIQAAAKRYDSSCLGRLSDLPAQHADYAKVAAVIQSGGVPFCSALRVLSNTFVTARHCFFPKRGGAAIVDRDDARLSLLVEPQRKLKILEMYGPPGFPVKESRTFSDAEDYLFLKTESLDTAMPRVNEEAPSPGKPLLLLGYFRFHQPEWVLGDQAVRGSPTDWWHGMRWSKAPMCVIGPVAKACVSHFCQTDHGFSGAGMLSRTASGVVEYYGIHIGAMRFRASSCPFDTESTAGNMGIRFKLASIARGNREDENR